MKVVSRERFFFFFSFDRDPSKYREGFRLLLVYVPAGDFVISWVDLFYRWGELRHLIGNPGFSFKGAVDLFCERLFSDPLLVCTGVCSPSECE